MSSKRIGVLLVHGIGSQVPNQHLVTEARNIAAALGESATTISVLREPLIADRIPDHFVPDYRTNMIEAEVTTQSGDQLRIEFNEAYWADLGEPPTLPRQISFWFWALSMWTVAGREFTRLPGFASMYVPKDGQFRHWNRFILGFYGALFFLGACTIGLLNLILDRLKVQRIPISDVLTAYVGDVMLYSQPNRDSGAQVSELGEPPRSDIRGRMIDAIAEFATRDYDRWYILAHSLGAVVAYNGLMETEACLPNYLGASRWHELKSNFPRLMKTVPAVPKLMLPRRPVWLAPTEGLDRRQLFDKLGGFLTYGSPLGKFRAIWPVIVAANKDEYVFRKDFKWFNIYDCTDPVAGRLDAFHRNRGLWIADRQQPAPLDDGKHSAAKITDSIGYSAGWVWLLSHLQYLKLPPPAYKRPRFVVAAVVAEWICGRPFNAAGLKSIAPWDFPRTALRFIEAALIGIVVWLSTAALVAQLLSDKWQRLFEGVQWPAAAVIAIVISILANVAGWLIERVNPPDAARAAAQSGKQSSLKGDLPRWGRALIVIVCLAAGTVVAWLGEDYARESISTLRHCTAAMWLAHLVDYLVPFQFAIGALSATTLTIVLLGAVRWMFQPLPVQPKNHLRGSRQTWQVAHKPPPRSKI